MKSRQLMLGIDAGVPAHGPGCKPIEGSHSFRFKGEPRYVCATNCPRRRFLAEQDTAIERGKEVTHENR